MKRSEMVDTIKQFLHGNSGNPAHRDEAEALLNTIEKAGMKPPEHSSRVENRIIDNNLALVRVYTQGWENE